MNVIESQNFILSSVIIEVIKEGGMEVAENIILKRKCRAIVGQSECVACGCCVLHCPKGAIHIERGLYAQIDPELCIGCGKCKAACPASVITIEEASR